MKPCAACVLSVVGLSSLHTMDGRSRINPRLSNANNNFHSFRPAFLCLHRVAVAVRQSISQAVSQSNWTPGARLSQSVAFPLPTAQRNPKLLRNHCVEYAFNLLVSFWLFGRSRILTDPSIPSVCQFWDSSVRRRRKDTMRFSDGVQ